MGGFGTEFLVVLKIYVLQTWIISLSGLFYEDK